MTKPTPILTLQEEIEIMENKRETQPDSDLGRMSVGDYNRELYKTSHRGKRRRLVNLPKGDFYEKYPLTHILGDGRFVKFPPLKGIQLKLPPSVNKMYIAKASRLVKSEEYANWIEFMPQYFLSEFYENSIDWNESVGVLIFTNLRRNSDLDNIQKGILDGLVKSEVFPDDNFVDFILTVRSKLPDEGFFMLNISEPFKNDKYWHERS